MIFRTVAKDSDKLSHKFGLLGVSFDEIGEKTKKAGSYIKELITYYKEAAKSAPSGTDTDTTNIPERPKYLNILKANGLHDIDKEAPILSTEEAEAQIGKMKDLINQMKDSSSGGIKNWKEFRDAMANATEGSKEFNGAIAAYAEKNRDGEMSAKGLIEATDEFREGLKQQNYELSSMTVKGRVATIAMEGLKIAMNSLVSIGIGLALEYIIGKIDDFVHAQENAIKAGNEAVETISEQNKKLQDASTTITDIQDDYQRLAKGVDNFGNNISLTTDEYAEYNKITNQIAEMFPTMVQGYTDEGNAIIKNKGNVDALTDAYDQMKESAKEAMIASSQVAYEGYQAKTQNVGIIGDAGLNEQKRALEGLIEAYSKGNDSWNNKIEIVKNAWTLQDQITDALESQGIKKGAFQSWDSFLNENIENNAIQNALKQINTNIEAENVKLRPVLQTYVEQFKAYENLSDQGKSVVSQIINQFNTDFFNRAEFDGDISKMSSYVVTNVIEKLEGEEGQKVTEAFANLFNLKNSDNISVDDFIAQGNQLLEDMKAQGFDDQVINTIKISLGLDIESEDSIDRQVNIVKKKFADSVGITVEEIEKGLDTKQLNIASGLEIPEGTLLSWDELIERINKVAESKISTDLTDFNEEIDAIQSVYDTLKSARDEYNKHGAYSLDTVQKLLQLEPQYLALLIDENGQMVINEEKLKDIIKLQIEEAKAKIYQAGINQLNALMESEVAGTTDDMASAKSGAVDDINAETEAINSNTKALAFNQAALDAQNMGISHEKIQAIMDNTENLIKGLNSVVNGLDLDFDGTVSGFEDSAEDAADKIDDLNENIKDTLKNIEDLNKEQALADLQKTIDDITNSLSLMEKTLERLNTLQDLTFEKDYTTKFQTVSQQFMEATKYGGQMRLELERLLSITPQTADEAETLASSLESLSGDFFENEKAIIEYRNSMYETAIEFIGESTENLTKQTSRAKEIFDQSISLSETGSLSGRGFWSRTLLPSVSKDKVKQQRDENKKLIKEEEDYQNSIAKIRQQATDMAKKEADEDRAEQLADYQKQLDEYKKQLAEYENSINTYKDTTIAATQANDNLMNSNNNVAGSFNNVASSAENATAKIEGFFVKKSEYDKAVAEMGDTKAPYAQKLPTNEYGKVPWIIPDEEYRFSAGFLTYNDKVSFKSSGGVSSGLTITNEGTGQLAGQEAYVGADRKLHLFTNGVHLSDLPPNTKIINAADLKEIIKYTGNKYFNEPIDDLNSITVNKYADGNTSVSVSRMSPLSDNSYSELENYLSQSFDNVKNNISFDNVLNALNKNLTNDAFYKKLANNIADKTSDAFADADKETSKSIKNLILSNSAWDDLPEGLQQKLSDIGANSDNWSSWITDDSNSLEAFNLMENSGTSSWDLLDENIKTLLNEYGIDGKETWDTFIEDNPMQALQLLTSSWDAMNNSITNYINDAITIATNGSKAINDIQIQSPQISQASWDNLQTLIANKIQEILNLINETFGANTIDLNFSVGLTGAANTNPQGDNTSPTGNALVDTAKQYLGTPYVWGGTTPSGFDCSGFVQYVYGQNGKSIPRTTYEQIKSGIAVDKSSLALGDLVFFGDSSAPHHVGMYVGNGKYIHAPQTGDVVKISDLSARSDYAGARRYAKGTQGATAGKAIVGEEYWLTGAKHPTPELIIKKTTGKAYLAGLNGAEVVNLSSGDTVVPYGQTNEILNGDTSFNTYARGAGYVRVSSEENDKNNNELKTVSNNKVVESWDVPDGLGKSHSYTAFDEDGYLGSKLGYWNTSSGAWKVFSSLLATGELTTDQNGIYMYKGARLVAMTSTFGKAGDVMRFTQDDGTVFYGIIMDEKSQVHTWYDNNPANSWGHNGGKDIVEFEVKKSAIAPAYKAAGGTPPYGNLNHYITMIENLGSLYGFDFSDIPSNGDTLSSKIQEFFNKLKSITGTYKTTTNTQKSKVAPIRSLGNTRQSNYSFDVPFTRKEHGGIANANTIVQTNEHHRQEATIDKNGNIVPIGDGSPQVLVSDHDFPVINANDYAQIKKYGGDKKPVKFLEKGNVNVSTDDMTEEGKEVSSLLKNIEDAVGEVSDEIRNLSKEELQGISYIVEAMGEDADTELTSDKLMEYKDIGIALKNIDEWIENDLDDLLNTYTDSYREWYNEEQKKYTEWQKDFREEFRGLAKNSTDDADYMSKYYAYLDKGSAKAREIGITQQEMYVDSVKETLGQLTEKRDMLLKFFEESPAEIQPKILELLETIEGSIEDIESEYQDSMQTLTDYIIDKNKQDRMRYTSPISYLQYDRNLMSEELSRATDPTQVADLYDEIDKNLEEEISLQNKLKEQAHQNVIDLRANATEEEKYLFDNYKFDEMFDADGEFNDAYYKALDTLEHDSPELIESFKYLANVIKDNKNAWQDADEAERQAVFEKQDNAITKANAKIDLEVEVYDKINDRLELRYNKEQAITNALEAQYSLQQSLRDEALEYEAQLKANKHLEEYLDPQAKALLFNDDDYSEMIAEIEDIGAEAQRLYEDYQADISTLGEQDYYQEQLITEEYNQQIEALNERLATKKQELEVSKKQLEYENTLKERDTRVILGGRSIQIADPDKLYNIEMERSKAEQQLENLKQDNLENQIVRDKQLSDAQIQEMISANEKYVETLQGLSDDEKVRHAEQMASTEELTAAIHVLSQDDIGWLNRYEYAFREQMGSFTDVEWGNGFDYNNDYSAEQEVIKMLYASGAITEEFYNTLMRANESKRNDKIAADPINSLYAPQTQEYGGQLAEPYYGVNGDEMIDNYYSLHPELQPMFDDVINEGKQSNLTLEKINNGVYDSQIASGENAENIVYAINDLSDVVKTANSKYDEDIKIDYAHGLDGQKYSIYHSQGLSYKFDDTLISGDGGVIVSVPGNVIGNTIASGEGSVSMSSSNGQTYQLGTTTISGNGNVITNKYKKYASGTKLAQKGMALVDEEAYELKLREIRAGKFVPLEQGDMIFDADSTKQLWDFANNPNNYIQDQLNKMSNVANQIQTTNNNSNNTNNNFTFTGNIVVSETIDNADVLFGSVINQAQSRYDVTKNMR